MRVAVIGSGISGIAAARIMTRLGHEAVVYERHSRIGGIWAHAYPDVRLQNIAEHYRFSDFPWPFAPDLHPNADQIMRYLEAAAAHYGLDIRLSHEVTAMTELADGWQLGIASASGVEGERFDHVVVAVGMFGDRRSEVPLLGRALFKGSVITEREVRDLDALRGKRVAIVGFGKTAVDLASMAAERGAIVHHVFRRPHWLSPRVIAGRQLADIVTARSSTAVLPSWVHVSEKEKRLHARKGQIAAYWRITEFLMRMTTGLHRFHLSRTARAGMRELEPGSKPSFELCAVGALAPDTYYPLVRQGAIVPVRGAVAGLYEDGIVIADGRRIEADVVLLAVGWKGPSFSFLPEPYRQMMTGEPDGTQLYRHMLHPSIPRVAFAGYNHGFLHMPFVEVSMVWYGAVISDALALPPPEEMAASAGRVAAWKRANWISKPSLAYNIGTHVHHYMDVLLMELGLNPHRKRSARAERREPYGPVDYAGVVEEFLAAKHAGQLKPLPYDT